MKVTFQFGGDQNFAKQLADQAESVKELGERLAALRDAVQRGGEEGAERGRR